MKITRKNVFETNSSSTHSISLSDNYQIPYLNYNGLVIKYDYFDEEEYNDFYSKACYLATIIFNNEFDSYGFGNHKEVFEEVLEETCCGEILYESPENGHYGDNFLNYDETFEKIFNFDRQTIKENIRKFLFSNNSCLNVYGY